MTFIQIGESTWLVPTRRSAITGRFLTKRETTEQFLTKRETTEQILERLEGYYREDN